MMVEAAAPAGVVNCNRKNNMKRRRDWDSDELLSSLGLLR